MRIIVPAIGSRGDVQPYIALCQELIKDAHDVVLATNPTMAPLVERYGVPCKAIGPPVDMGVEGAKLWDQAGNRMWLGMMRVMRLASSLIEDAYPDLLELCRGADLVIVSDPTAGAAEAGQLGVPWISVTLQPGRVPVPRQPQGIGDWLMMKLIWPVLGKLMVMPINRFRGRVGAPKVMDIGQMMSDRMVLLPVSPHVVPPDERWPSHVRMTGYWDAHAPGDWGPPGDMVDFIEAGSRPVSISLGAMSLAGGQAREAAQITLQALNRCGARAIIQGWDDVLAGIELPSSVYHAGAMPHSWLFSQVAAVVHHGGFGTTAAGLRSGSPSIVVPHIIDQFYWAQRVEELGVGPRPVRRADLSVESLSEVIEQAISDEEMRSRADDLGNRIRSEPPGLARAVELINTLD